MYQRSAAGVALEGGLLLSEGNASVASWRLSRSLVSDSGPPSTRSPETRPWFALVMCKSRMKSLKPESWRVTIPRLCLLGRGVASSR